MQSSVPDSETSNRSSKIERFLLAVLSSRFEAITREMVNTVMKASRSGVIKNSRDMSCGLLTFDHRLLCVEDCIPVHVSALDLTTKPITEFSHPDDVSCIADPRPERPPLWYRGACSKILASAGAARDIRSRAAAAEQLVEEDRCDEQEPHNQDLVIAADAGNVQRVS
jgi:Hydantoinase B/oxoprolinase